MFGNTIDLTYDNTLITLSRINQDNYGSEYYLEEGNKRFTLTIGHKVPGSGKQGEQHTAKLQTEIYDVDTGEYSHADVAWTVMRTFNKVQQTASLLHNVNALTAFTVDANNTKLLARES